MACGTRRRRKSRCRSKSKRRRRRSSCKMGKITRNPFFNFLRCFRSRHCGWSAKKVAIQGAKAWCKMSKSQRRVFYKLAKKRSKCKSGPLIIRPPCCKQKPRKRKHKSCKPKRRKRSSCPRKKKKRSCSKKRKRRSCRRNTEVQNATE